MTAMLGRGLARALRPSVLLRSCPPPLLARSLSTQPPSPPASNTQSVVEISSNADFDELCMKASSTPPPLGGPVILDFYADWCQPCKTLTPKLAQFVEASQGAVRLAKINVDNLPELAQALQIGSLPTVMLIHKGKMVDSFQGVPADEALKKFLTKAVELGGGANGAVGPKALEAAAALLASGDLPGATGAYAELLQLPEMAASARAGLALCALGDGDLAMAQEMVAELHKSHAKDLNLPDVRKAISTVELAADAPEAGEGRAPSELRALLEANPKDHTARYELAQALLGSGDQEEAIEQLLLIVRRDKNWEEGKHRELLLKLFDALGNDNEITKKGRRKLANYTLL